MEERTSESYERPKVIDYGSLRELTANGPFFGPHPPFFRPPRWRPPYYRQPFHRPPRGGHSFS
jgi:hypothetical protein